MEMGTSTKPYHTETSAQGKARGELRDQEEEVNKRKWELISKIHARLLNNSAWPFSFIASSLGQVDHAHHDGGDRCVSASSGSISSPGTTMP